MAEGYPIAYRELYAPIHVHSGNNYVHMSHIEAEASLAEAKWWGFNAYGDWFDMKDFPSPETRAKGDGPEAWDLMERKIDFFRIAAHLGFELDLMLTPNQVYQDQYDGNSGLNADTSNPPHPGFYGPCLCPSNPEAREIILRNHRILFAELKTAGVIPKTISACPYDYGGCTCERCHPWTVTFGRLVLEILEEAKAVFPGVEARAVAWCFSDDEYPLFKTWADQEARGVFRSMALFVKKNQSAPPAGMVLPEGCQPNWFVHCCYSERSGPVADPLRRLDEYSLWGPVIAPARLSATVQELRDQGVNGFLAYSEGGFDDVNKAVVGGLASGKYGTSHEVLMAYAERHFDATGADRGKWADWIAAFGCAFDLDLVAARRKFDSLAGRARRSWRLEQLEARLELFEAHAAVMAHSEWNASRLEAADRFFAARERLFRLWGVWLPSKTQEHDWEKEWRARYGERRYTFVSEKYGEIVE